MHRQYAWFSASGAVLSTFASLAILAAGGDVVLDSFNGSALFAVSTFVAWKLSGLSPRSRPRLFIAERLVGFGRAGLPFVSWQLAQIAYSQSTVCARRTGPASPVGWYAAANRIIAIPIFIPTLIITPLFPALSRNAHAPQLLRRSIADTLRITLALIVPISAGTIVVAPVIPHCLAGRYFSTP